MVIGQHFLDLGFGPVCEKLNDLCENKDNICASSICNGFLQTMKIGSFFHLKMGRQKDYYACLQDIAIKWAIATNQVKNPKVLAALTWYAKFQIL